MSKLAGRRIAQIEALEARVALTAQLLLDFNADEAPFRASHFTELHGESYFVANSGSAQNIELWKTDGTKDGTSPVAEIESGLGRQLRVTTMVRLEDQLAFLTTESDPPFGRLYVSDGTSAGTRHVTNLPFSGGVTTTPLQVIDGSAYFSADPWHGDKILMVTDGTEEGTRRLVRQKGPSDNYAVTDHGQFSAAGGNIVRRRDGQYVQFATQLWFHDEQTGMARVVREIDSGDRDSYADPMDLTAVGSNVYFTAKTSLGRELWFSDSTPDGTELVRDLRVGEASTRFSSLTAVGNALYFLADDGDGNTLWRAEQIDETFHLDSVGAPLGLVHGQLLSDSNSLYVLAQSDGGFDVVAYSMADGAVSNLGNVDGTSASLQQTKLGVAVITTVRSQFADQQRLAIVKNSNLVEIPEVEFTRFLGDDDTIAYFESRGPEETTIWYTEGTQASTRPVGTVASVGGAMIVGESLVLSARHDGDSALWSVDDTFTKIASQMPRNGSSTYHSIDVVDNKAIITVEAGFNIPHYVTWRADTFVADDTQIRKLVNSPFVWGQHGGWPDRPYFHKVANEYFFAAQSPTENGRYREEVWKTDLTPEGTDRSSFEELSALDSSIAKEPLFGFYSSDPTPPPGAEDYIEFEGQLRRVVETTHGRYFVDRRGGVNRLYRQVEDEPPEFILETGSRRGFHFSQLAGYQQMHRALIAFDDIVYFVGSDALHGDEVWRSDGSPAGTHMLVDLNPGSMSSQPNYIGAIGGNLFVQATTPTHGREIWSITPSGEARVHEIREGAAGAGEYMGIAGDTLFVAADDGQHGREVWAIRPTGDPELFDINPGEVGSVPLFDPDEPWATASVGDSIYFSADDGVHGRELWVIDGQAVRLERDIREGPVGSYPIVQAQLPGAILLVANDGIHGRELWTAIPDKAPIAGDVNGDGKVSMDDFLILAENFGKQSGSLRSEGDLDGDKDIDFDDFLVLSANFGKRRAAVVDAAFARS